MIIFSIIFGVWVFGIVISSNFLWRAVGHLPINTRFALLVDAAFWPLHLFPYLVGSRRPNAHEIAAGQHHVVAAIRVALIIGTLACLGEMWRELNAHGRTAPSARAVSTLPSPPVAPTRASSRWLISI